MSVTPIWLGAQDTTRRDTMTATLAGRVFIDSTRQPIIAAEVALLDVGKSVLTDERGAFRIADIPAGAHRLMVRRIGFGPLETTIVFAARETIDRNIFLARAVTLDSVRTTALRGADLEFEENRRLGLGHFLTRKDLEKVGVARLSAVLTTIPGIRIQESRPPHPPEWYVVNNRRGCFAAIVLDGMRMYTPRSPTEPPFNINSLNVGQIETIEYYAGATQLPARYQGPGADACGVLVIRTRR
jgi:hypothetical protein